jgi:hypothetical protein
MRMWDSRPLLSPERSPPILGETPIKSPNFRSVILSKAKNPLQSSVATGLSGNPTTDLVRRQLAFPLNQSFPGSAGKCDSAHCAPSSIAVNSLRPFFRTREPL